MNINNVLIVGGGIGGLCTAIALRQAGVAVDVVEIQPQWRAEQCRARNAAAWGAGTLSGRRLAV